MTGEVVRLAGTLYIVKSVILGMNVDINIQIDINHIVVPIQLHQLMIAIVIIIHQIKNIRELIQIMLLIGIIDRIITLTKVEEFIVCHLKNIRVVIKITLLIAIIIDLITLSKLKVDMTGEEGVLIVMTTVREVGPGVELSAIMVIVALEKTCKLDVQILNMYFFCTKVYNWY